MNRRLRNPAEVGMLFTRLADMSDLTLLVVAESVVETGRQRIEGTFGQSPPLAPLQDSTIAEKARMGAPQPDDPLILSGAYRASFHSEVKPIGIGIVEGQIATDDPVAVWQEFGTSKMPPRPVVRDGITAAEPETLAIIKAGAREIATGELETAIRAVATPRPTVFELPSIPKR